MPRISRWTSQRPARATSNRLLLRLIGIPALAFAGVLIWRGLQERLTLPECDSSRAKSTLSDVLKQLKVEPLRDEPIKTVSNSKRIRSVQRRAAAVGRRQLEHRLQLLLAGKLGADAIFDIAAAGAKLHGLGAAFEVS